MTIWSCDTCLRDQSFRATETPISAKRVTPSNYTYTHRRTHAHTCKHIKDLCTHFQETFPCVFMNTTVIYTTLWSCWVARYTLFGKIYLESCFEHLYNVNQKGVEEINRRRWERQIHKQILGWERVNIEVFERINTGLVKRVCLVKFSSTVSCNESSVREKGAFWRVCPLSSVLTERQYAWLNLVWLFLQTSDPLSGNSWIHSRGRGSSGVRHGDGGGGVSKVLKWRPICSFGTVARPQSQQWWSCPIWIFVSADARVDVLLGTPSEPERSLLEREIFKLSFFKILLATPCHVDVVYWYDF